MSEEKRKISESIFDGKTVVIPMADVQHIEKRYYNRDLANGTKKGDYMDCLVITKHTTWNHERDCWENSIWLGNEQAKKFMDAWCYYRYELEKDDLVKD